VAAPDPRGDDDLAARRRRARRFGLLLLGGVLLLVAATIGYVELFGHVLRDPSRPPTVTSPTNPRVFVFEIVLAAVVLIVISVISQWLRRRHDQPGKQR